MPRPAGEEGTNSIALVTGAGGLIGSYLVKTAARWAPEWRVQGLSRSEVDLTDMDRVRELWRTLKPSLVIHCAAMSRTEACERDPALARKLNVEVTALLADLSANLPFVFFSSDQVFDGRAGWYMETDEPHPLNVYAETKLAAERHVLAHPRHTVVRTSLNAGWSPTGDRSFVEEMRRAWQAGRRLMLFTDEFRCPIPAGVTARAVWELTTKNRPGLYHLAGAERLSRWDIGRLLAAQWSELRAEMAPGSVRDYAGPYRPPDLSLNCDKIQAVLSFRLPGFGEWLAGRAGRNHDPWDYESP
ncbi:MAG TPA: SDR family oxidoreductase [Nitrospiraceae bacterium]|jgi:dTDP-4-dehydrorhamnose reductase|nr:SDR family oxidoreductase [Nitrospiraceae bacterium]